MLNFIEANRIRGKVYALYNWGGYIHWRTDGDLKVFIDGRADTIYDADTYRHYTSVLVTKDGWQQLIETSGAEYILWPHLGKGGQEKLQALLDSGRWRPVYRDAVSWLLVRQDVPRPEKWQPSPQGPWRDLASAQISAWGGQSAGAIQYATKTREVIPWHMGACNVLVDTHRERREPVVAEEIREDCRGYFPSMYLR
jgi:hypothetical protein